jgi:hypothetical protein
MGLLDEIKPTAGNESRNGYFPPVDANYTVRIERCKTTQDGNAFIVELEVLESDTDQAEAGEFKDWFRSTVAQPGKGWQRERAAQEILTFLTAAAGFDPDKPAERERFFEQHKHGGALYDAAITANALDSVVLKLRTNVKKTKATKDKPNGGEFTSHIWQPAKDAPKKEPAPPPADPCAGWERDPSGLYALDPVARVWCHVATGQPA